MTAHVLITGITPATGGDAARMRGTVEHRAHGSTWGSAPGFTGEAVILGVEEFELDDDGEYLLHLEPCNGLLEGTFYVVRIAGTTERLQPTGDGSWLFGDPAIKAPPGPPPVRYIEGPPGTVDAAGSVSFSNITTPDVPSSGARLWSAASGATDVLRYRTRTGAVHDVSVDTKVDPRKYGAVCDGAADDTAALHAALDAASAAGGGTVVLPPGKIGISDVVDVPMWVNLVGVAAGINSAATTAGSTLVALHADAQLRFGFVGATPRGGMSGNFSIDGRDLAGAGGLLHVHHSVQRTFQQIEVCDSIGDGIVLDRTQNSVYVNLRALRCVGDGIRLDRSAGNNTLIGCGARKIGGAHIRFGAQDNGSGGDVTFGNVFLGGVFEEFYDGTGQSTAVLLVESSRGNIIDGLNLVNGGTLTGAESAVVQVMAGTLMMSRCRMTGQTVNDGVYVAPGATCIATANAFQNCPNAYVVDAGSSLSNTDDFGSYTNLYRVVSGGDASGVFRRSRSTLRFDLDPTLGGAWIQARLAGDSFARVIVNDGNGLAFGSGSAAVDTALRRQNQHQLRTPDFFEALGGLRTLAKTGGAVTNADFPDLASPPGSGTIAVDEDNNRLYVKVGSTWRYVDLT